ncbi:Exocyst complex component 1 [Strongyloides ratti]|uniref:Exocyst complex component 1 n=1 Tax=Strongyloides ratti TaxID=34506 RepID=A0A090MYE8_STRRB|nr:Exocyst complex component 1 [Strongyloides ratti]CEF67059.1 Exocyst complex component 1 [Strongyloides ratti]
MNKDNLGDDYQPISAKEEHDFRMLLEKSNLTIGEAEKFSFMLTDQLMQLDGANIESIMGSEQAVTDLMNVIDSALNETITLGEMSTEFDSLIAFVRESVELIEEKYSLGMLEMKNTHLLIHELVKFIESIESVADEHIYILQNANLSDPTSINRCTSAAKAIQNFIKEETPLKEIKAYQEHLKNLNKVTDTFVDKLMAHLSPLFTNSNTFRDSGEEAYELSLRKHSQRFHSLLVYSNLILWLKQTRHGVYTGAIQKYVELTKQIYKKDFQVFFETLNKHLTRFDKGRTLSRTMFTTEKSFVESFQEEETNILNLLDTALFEVSSVVESEQKFCTRFFHIHTDIFSSIDTQSIQSSDSGSKNSDKLSNDQVRIIISPLFDVVNGHLEQFAKTCCKQNPYSAITLFVSMSKKISKYQNTNSYFSVIFGRLMVLIKRQFDFFMETEGKSYCEVKLIKRTRIKIIDAIDRFYNLALIAEKSIQGAERRKDLDRWYTELVSKLITTIDKMASSPHSKSPSSVVKFENYHHLYSRLSELKIECLDKKRKEMKKLYQDNIDLYVKEHMGRPLEKIHLFFERIERAIESGMSPEEVGYQTQFSKNELKKVISSYPGKEIKKGLEQLYKKMEKHLTEESNLLQVVWRNMQDTFLKQIKHYQNLIAKCYNSSKIELEVSIDDVLQFFSEIAQQH